MTKRLENIQRKFVALCYNGYPQHRLPPPANSTNDYSDWHPLHDRKQQSDTVFAHNFGGLWILYIFHWRHWPSGKSETFLCFRTVRVCHCGTFIL